MKNLILIALIITVFLSCKKNGTAPQSTITGKWYLATDSNAQFKNDTLVTGYTITQDHQNYITFNSNGSGIQVGVPGINNLTDTIEFSYKVSGTTLTINIPEQTGNGLQYDAYTEAATIKSLTDTRLTLYYNITQINGKDSYHIIETQTFVK